VNAHFSLAGLASLDSTSMPPLSRARGAFRRGSPGRAPSRAPAPEPCSRWPTGAGAARVHRGSRTSTRPFSAPLSRGVSWPRALQRLLQIDVSTSTTMGRSSIPCRDKQQGWPPLSIDRCLSIDGYRRRSSGSGVEDHRASTFPPGIAPERDFAPTTIASDTSCRGHCLSPCLESTRVTGEAAGAASASKARVTGGRCVARFPRRNPTSSRPRCLPSQGRPRT
jgi:hypothetical protein